MASEPWPNMSVRLTALVALVAISLNSAAESAADQRPNIVFLLADDLGYSDTAPYGSEVNTPSISALAEQGILFTNYHTAANCAPARAMLLTGVSNHLAGVPNIPEMLAPEQRVHDNYQGVLGNNVVTIATLLEDAGYHTYMAGKWHLGAERDQLPSQRGFERTVALMDSGADNWEQRPYLPIYDTANWFADGKRFTLPDDFYSSRFLIDKTIEFIDENAGDGKPFFAYVPFQAVHMPVQAPQQYIDRYMGLYDQGWHKVREQRLARAVEMGVFPESVSMQHMATTADWETLSAERKKYEAKRMAVYAGMIEAMDANIGRLMSHLASRGLADNTIFIFTSDNGAEGSGPPDPNAFPASRLPASLGYSTDYETLGLKGFNGCRFEHLVAFSCKHRGFCPSCGARRMVETSAHLIDHVIPTVPVRQWVLSFPWPLRLLFARQPNTLSRCLAVIIRAVETDLIHRAGLTRASGARSGIVTLIQRFGSALNLNPDAAQSTYI